MLINEQPQRTSLTQQAAGAVTQHQRGTAVSPPALQLMASPIQRESPEGEEMQLKANPLQREAPEEEEMQLKADPLQREGMEEDELMMKADPLQRETSAPAADTGSGAIAAPVREHMESAFGADFSDVKIHADSPKAPEVGALAYTQGSDIHFAPGQLDTASSKGRELLGHELTHVVQQREGRVQPTGEVQGLPLNDDAGLEREADEMGSKVSRL
ncbi:MAG: hypothetical protein OHK0039_16110 [Bacteroidia bacterium]